MVNGVHAQDTTATFKPDTTHSPKKAAILAATLPGAGQIYNKKYWKLPIVYGGLGASIYFIITNHNNYQEYRNEYLFRLENNYSNPEYERFTDNNLITLQDQYRRWRDLSYVTLAAFYVFQIVDATVDAHLMNFDVSDDISFRWRPSILNIAGKRSAGFTLSLKL